MAATMNDNLQGALALLRSAAEGLGIEIYESIQTPLKDIVKVGADSISQLTEAFQSGGTEGLIEAGGQIIANLLTGIAGATPKVLDISIQIIQSLVQSLSDNMSQISNTGVQIVKTLAQGISELLPMLGTLAYEILTRLLQGIVDNASTAMESGSQFLISMMNGISSKLPELVPLALQALLAFAHGIVSNLPSIADLGIMIDARATKLTYDCILERVSTVTIGDTEYNFFNEAYSAVDRVDQAIRSDGTVIAEQVYGAINTLNAFLHAQSTAAKRTDSVAYLIEDLDQNSELYGAMEAGTQGLRLAKERKDGEWIWRTAVTAAGIIADLIVTGKIQDRLGKSYWDLDNGKMLLSGIFQQITDNGKKSVDIKNNRINIYSWQKEGDYVGSIGSLAIGDDLNEKQRIGVYCDTEDMLVFGYSSKKTAEGDAATVHELMKLSKDGGIECTEIPQINGTKTGRLVFSNGTYVNVKNGYIVGGKTEEGSF